MAVATDSRRFFRTYDKLNQNTFLACIKALQCHFGLVTSHVPDSATHYKTRTKVYHIESGHTYHTPVTGHVGI